MTCRALEHYEHCVRDSSDTIAIFVRKISGNVTSMVSPSFFWSALTGMEDEQIPDISAISLEHSFADMKWKREPSMNESSSMDVGIKPIQRDNFDGIDF